MINKSNVYCDGTIWETNNHGQVEVIGMSPRVSQKRGKDYIGRFFYVKFKDGTIVEANISSLKNGEVRNPNKPTGIKDCFIGQGIYCSKIKGKKTDNYKLWSAMTQRVYSESYHKKYPSYKNCTLSVDWHNYQKFSEDIRDIEDYELWVKDPHNYHLDKDIKVKGNKHYSKENCLFVTSKENIAHSNRSRHEHKG
ncbi:MAG: hypothetical protein GY775_04165 [Candidatus Scalindua sp.]|nr:hypothetical protein [Candidatus Scalindua sp.]